MLKFLCQVVLSACRAHYSLADMRNLPKIVSTLLRLTHAAPSPQVERVVLSYLVYMTRESPVSPTSDPALVWLTLEHRIFLSLTTRVFSSDRLTSLRLSVQR